MIIGITGTLGAGKGAIVELLKTKGFRHYSVRKFLTEEILKRGLEVNRENMVSIANELRAKFGSSYIVEQLYSEASKVERDVVIESIRTVGEIDALREKGNFILFAVDADPEVRYSRIVDRDQSTDKISFEEFLKQEEREMHSQDPNKQNLSACMERADYLFKNDWTIETLHEKVSAVLGKRGPDVEKYVRPTWDEYFMEIVHVVSRRGTCDRGRTAVVVVKDKVILVTGYVGSPMGTAHCDEVGHLMKEVIHQDGTTSRHCMRTNHAEVNAVALAARKGIRIEGSTMYMKMSPCYTCAKMLINTGIKRIVCDNLYHQAGDAIKIMKEAGIQVDVLHKEVEKYEGQ